jgi:hypothetical protein
MLLRTSSISHMGVEVAPHMPSVVACLYHSGLISSGDETKYVLGLVCLHTSNNTLPLDDLVPDTKMTTS